MKIKYTFHRGIGAWLGDVIVVIPDQVDSTEALHTQLDSKGVPYTEWPDNAQRYHDQNKIIFPAILPNGRKIKVQLDGDAYGLYTSGTGDAKVKIAQFNEKSA